MHKKSTTWILFALWIIVMVFGYVMYENVYSTGNIGHSNTGVVTSFNIHHPELKPGEIFLGNASWDSYEHIGWTTKRPGKTAYDIYGEKAGEMVYGFYADQAFFPVFVQEYELADAGIDVEKLKRGEVELLEEDYLSRPFHR